MLVGLARRKLRSENLQRLELPGHCRPGADGFDSDAKTSAEVR
jgi:hypothetical protein